MRESVELARQLAAAGVTAAVCTPHFSRRYPTPHRVARDRLAELDGLLLEAAIRVSLAVAAEVSPTLAVSSPARELVARSIGGRFLLVELERDTPAVFLDTALDQLAPMGLRPVFAHPERCRALRGRPRVLEEARAGGAVVQIVAPSLTGRWGDEIALAAWRLLDAGVVDLLGSDSHRPSPSLTHLERAAALVDERHGPEALRNLVELRPAEVVGGVAARP